MTWPASSPIVEGMEKRMLLWLALAILPGCRSESPPAAPYYAVADDQGEDGMFVVIDAVTGSGHHIDIGTGLEFVREDPEYGEGKVVMRATSGRDRGRLFRMVRAQITASRPSP